MGGFLVFKDGRALALNNQATDAVLRAVAAEIRDPSFREWALGQQSSRIGFGMTSIDIRELSPLCQEEWRAAIQRSCAAVVHADPDQLPYGLRGLDWPEHFDLLARMLAASEAGEPVEELNPHMQAPLQPTHDRVGPGWE